MKQILFFVLLLLPLMMPAQTTDETYAEVTINGLPALECFVDDGAGAKPLVMMLHGYGGSKESMKEAAAFLAKAGLFVVMPQAYAHKGRPNYDQITVVEIAHRTAAELDTFFNHYATDKRVQADRFGLLGVSMGAIATYAYLAKGTGRVRAAVPLIGTPDFPSIEGIELARTIRGVDTEGRMATDEEYARLIRFCKENNPLDRWEKMRGVHLLMQNGNKDPLIKLYGVEELFKRLTTPREEGIDVQLDIYDMDHTLTMPIVEKSILFLHKHLQGR